MISPKKMKSTHVLSIKKLKHTFTNWFKMNKALNQNLNSYKRVT